MKRKKDSTPRVTSQRCNKDNHELSPYFANLPSHIIAHILLQLPIKSLICRFVCKNWKTLISEPYFAKSHFEQAPSCFMIRPSLDRPVSRTLYLLESGPEKLAPIFKLPLRNAKSLMEKRYEIYKPNRDQYKFGVVNSCNGFLCLCHPYEGIPLVICNPVTGEFIRLPKATTTRIQNGIAWVIGNSGFGFQPKSNEYKVMYIWRKYDSIKRVNNAILMIHTLGTPSWRNVEVDPEVSISLLMDPTCVNGALHWIEFGGRQRSIVCLCLESERFQSFSSPPFEGIPYKRSRMGELRGFLYIFDTTSFRDVTMLVMKKYGIGNNGLRFTALELCPVLWVDQNIHIMVYVGR